jgi:hypothetical protein
MEILQIKLRYYIYSHACKNKNNEVLCEQFYYQNEKWVDIASESEILHALLKVNIFYHEMSMINIRNIIYQVC